jgi:hypothetical protein
MKNAIASVAIDMLSDLFAIILIYYELGIEVMFKIFNQLVEGVYL